jgi:hypothetical protein
MFSGFSYKGIDIYTITKNEGDKTVPGYNFFGVNTDDDGLRPLPFGLNYQGTSLTEYCSATTTNLYTDNETSTINIPDGCKYFAFYGIGGGGGGGGGGQNATVKVVAGKDRKGNGAAGGAGVTAGYMSGYQISTDGQTTMQIVIGEGGNGGHSSSGNSSVTTNAGKSRSTKGEDGRPGGEGKETSITIGTNTYKTTKAPGGNGGQGGKATYNGTNFDDAAGVPGSTPVPTTQPSISYGNAAKFPHVEPYGNGGPGGGGGGGHDGKGGSGGALQIIWLYE